MMNVGDEKGEILDAAIGRAAPQRLLELGTYCGYSALRTARAMPDGAHLWSLEFMREREGREWRTVEHETHVEYQTLIKDLVLESEYLPYR